MNAINRKSFKKLAHEFGARPIAESSNPVLDSVIKEIEVENKIPFEIGPNGDDDEKITEYFGNTYAYVKFSK